MRATPLHRAVRTRSAPAVRALLAGGADVFAQEQEWLHAVRFGDANHGTGWQPARRSPGNSRPKSLRRCSKPARDQDRFPRRNGAADPSSSREFAYPADARS